MLCCVSPPAGAFSPSILPFWERLLSRSHQDIGMDISTSDAGSVHPSLETLPSELRKLIVSFLAPAYLAPGCKQALRSANLAHRCLHEWATEYLFQGMVLMHAAPGMASHLEYFTTHREAAGFLKYVKRVVIQVAVMHKEFIRGSDCHRCHRHYVGKLARTGLSSAERRSPESAFIPHSVFAQLRK